MTNAGSIGKGSTAIRLWSKGRSVRQIALIIYNDDSRVAQKRVWALLSKFNSKRLRSLHSEPQPQPQILNLKSPTPTDVQPEPEPQPQPQILNLKSPTPTDVQPEPEPQPQPEPQHSSDTDQGLPINKDPETVEKGKASETVTNWLDEDTLARQLADECYGNSKCCVQEKDFENACRFLELVSRFLRLSQTARKEYDLEEIKKELARYRKNK